jgi:hypothetical protein
MEIVAAQRVFFSHPSAPLHWYCPLRPPQHIRSYIHVFLGGFGTQVARFYRKAKVEFVASPVSECVDAAACRVRSHPDLEMRHFSFTNLRDTGMRS